MHKTPPTPLPSQSAFLVQCPGKYSLSPVGFPHKTLHPPRRRIPLITDRQEHSAAQFKIAQRSTAALHSTEIAQIVKECWQRVLVTQAPVNRGDILPGCRLQSTSAKLSVARRKATWSFKAGLVCELYDWINGVSMIHERLRVGEVYFWCESCISLAEIGVRGVRFV